MTEQDALTLIERCLDEVLGTPREYGTPDPDADLRDLGVDSAKSLELAGALEDELATEFPDARLERVRTVRDLVRLILESAPE